jgi:hypothetical protein
MSSAQQLLGRWPLQIRNIGKGITLVLTAGALVSVFGSTAQGVGQHGRGIANLPDFPMRAGSKPPVAAFFLKGSNNYRLSILGIGKRARLAASKGHAAAIYWTENAVTTNSGLRARFGNLGRISVTFRPVQQHPGLGRSSCSSDESRGVELGTFVGKIRFQGEQGFTRVDATHVRGGILPKSACRSAARRNSSDSAADAASKNKDPFVEGGAITRRGSVSFKAGAGGFAELKALDPYGEFLDLDGLRGGGVPFSATAFEVRREMRILRLVAAKGPKASFLNDVVAGTKTIVPPPPFAGVGEFSQCPRPTWRGTLRVSFPGRANQPLTGDRFYIESGPISDCG